MQAQSISTSHVQENLQEVLQRIEQASKKAGRTQVPKLVAVSKYKTEEEVYQAFQAGQKVFGENYVQELVDKAEKLPQEIQWHFIGHLQSNKVKQVVEKVPNLDVVESLDTDKLANKLNQAIESYGQDRKSKLKIYVQVNTSGEEQKSGVQPSDALPLAKYIQQNCQNIQLAGLMTIGMNDYTSTPKNFNCLKECRQEIIKELNLNEEDIELSMGMSGDYESAIEMGSTAVRIGSSIFGARATKEEMQTK